MSPEEKERVEPEELKELQIRSILCFCKQPGYDKAIVVVMSLSTAAYEVYDHGTRIKRTFSVTGAAHAYNQIGPRIIVTPPPAPAGELQEGGA